MYLELFNTVSYVIKTTPGLNGSARAQVKSENHGFYVCYRVIHALCGPTPLWEAGRGRSRIMAR